MLGASVVVQGKQNVRIPYDPMAVRWMESHGDAMDKVWRKLPGWIKSCSATVAIFTLGATLRGEWLVVLVHYLKHIGVISQTSSEGATLHWSDITLESLRLQNLRYFLVLTYIASFGMYFVVGGFLHWYFYVNQRGRPAEWKCQPHKWMSPETELHEILIGSFNLLITSSFAAVLSCYISNGGWCMVYYEFDEYSWCWFFMQGPVLFVYQDYISYWLHRTYHTPFLYKHFHKLHHKYKQPTAFSVTAIHPFEIMHIQITLCVPLFAIPIHWVPFYMIAFYSFYHGIIDHSGVNFKSQWWQPWQPDAIFHDNHHQYVHVNFGLNMLIWDKIHGTARTDKITFTQEISPTEN